MAAPEGTRVPEEPLLLSLLEDGISLLNNEDQVLWTIFGVYSATVSILFVALFSTGEFPARNVGLIISILGLGFSFAWLLIQRRSIGYMNAQCAAIKEIHGTLMAPYQRRFWVWDQPALERLVPWPPARDVMLVVIGAITISWALFLGYFASISS